METLTREARDPISDASDLCVHELLPCLYSRFLTAALNNKCVMQYALRILNSLLALMDCLIGLHFLNVGKPVSQVSCITYIVVSLPLVSHTENGIGPPSASCEDVPY